MTKYKVAKKNLNFLTNLLKYKLHMHKSEQFQLYMKYFQANTALFVKRPKGSPYTE